MSAPPPPPPPPPPPEPAGPPEPEEEILGSDDEEQEDPADYCKGQTEPHAQTQTHTVPGHHFHSLHLLRSAQQWRPYHVVIAAAPERLQGCLVVARKMNDSVFVFPAVAQDARDSAVCREACFHYVALYQCYTHSVNDVDKCHSISARQYVQ